MNLYEEINAEIDSLCINTIRTLTMDAVQKAKSGHPGAPMGLASGGYVLWTRVMKHNPSNADWINRDRFVLSCGHASMLLYGLLYISGYDLTIDDIKKFRQIGSKTPGHPEYGQTPGVETTTGPLGQGLANAVGMAIAEKNLSARYNRPGYNIIDHYTYVICGDGDLMEGISYESASLAGHLGLSKLICLYDSNDVTIEGNTNITFTENLVGRFNACGWNVLLVEDGNNLKKIEKAFISAKENNYSPSIIILKTDIAFGSPNLQGRSESHGSPLGEDEVRLSKIRLNWLEDKPFFVPDKVLFFRKKFISKCLKYESFWIDLYKSYARKFPELSDELLNSLTHFIPKNLDEKLPKFNRFDHPIATRVASGKMINYFAEIFPSLIGGSSDLAPSNKTYITSSNDFQKNCYKWRNIRFGVREFAMGGIMTGMFIHGGLRPYGGTFLVFSDYMRPAIRVASIMKIPIIYIFTHDSVAVGEDGPTHQPVEHLSALRTIPGLVVIRPADANETVEAWKIAMISNNRPMAIILSRQKLPILEYEKVNKGVEKGAYVIEDCEKEPDALIIATGSEVHISLEAKKLLEKCNVFVRVISMPSWELFEEQPDTYKNQVISTHIKYKIAVESGVSMGWRKYIGDNGIFVGVDNYGVSGPGEDVMNKFGICPKNIVDNILKLLNRK